MNHTCRLLLRGPSMALALAISARASAAGPSAAAPEVRFQHETAYMSGGVGSDERDAIHAIARRSNVRLGVMLASTGEALLDVSMSVADDRDKFRLRVCTGGPLLYMRLPHGHYQVTVAYRDAMQTMNVSAGAQPADAVVRLRTEPGPDERLLCQRECPCAGARPAAR